MFTKILIANRGEIALRIHWNEKSRMLKLSVPTLFPGAEYLGQAAFGVQSLPTTGREVVAQKWTAAVDRATDAALTCINDGVYGSDFLEGELRLSLLRSAAYSGHPIADRPIVLQDRYTPRIDQGERLFRFWFNAGPVEDRLARIDREALAWNERPMALSFYPPGTGAVPEAPILIDDDVVQLSAIKLAEDGDDLVVRLFEPTGHARTAHVRFPVLGADVAVDFGPFEIKTFRLNAKTRQVVEVDLLERPV